MTVDWSELKQLAADFGTVDHKLATRVMDVTRKAGFDLERIAKGKAPVDTGYLRRSIGTSFNWSSAGATVEVGPTAYYGVFVEFGTRRMGAQPYMEPALNAVEAPFAKAILQLTGEVLW